MEDLFEAAKRAAERSHSPYSGFPVGAAIRSASGRVHLGANMENAAYPEGWCAETSALAHMVMAGETAFSEVAVYAPKMEGCTPCGGCRQRLAEFATEGAVVHLCGRDGVMHSVAVSDLLPAAFDL